MTTPDIAPSILLLITVILIAISLRKIRAIQITLFQIQIEHKWLKKNNRRLRQETKASSERQEKHALELIVLSQSHQELINKGALTFHTEIEALKNITSELHHLSSRNALRIKTLEGWLNPVHRLKPVRFLFIGCGRSGTHYTAAVFSALGADAAHETPASDVTASWIHTPEKYRSEMGLQAEIIIHQHRNPISSISSIMTLSDRAWIHILKYAPECDDPDPVCRAAKYWIKWNLMAEASALFSFSIEAISTPTIREHLSHITGYDISISILDEAKPKKNSRKSWSKYQPLSASILRHTLPPNLFSELESLAIHYGYKLTDETQ